MEMTLNDGFCEMPVEEMQNADGGIVIAGFLISYIVSKIPQLNNVSDSMKISVITIIISGLAAFFFPIPKENEPADTDITQEEA